MKFYKVLAKYYKTWLINSKESAEYCRKEERMALANYYEARAKEYERVISENEEAIEFFSQGQNAHMIDSVLPEKFRGYE